jgi:hypothetical protein
MTGHVVLLSIHPMQEHMRLLAPRGPTALPGSVRAALEGPARPLPPASRQAMEARYGHDFGAVRVHDDARAAESARTLHARAYAVGHDLVFAGGRWAPGTPAGDALLAHELGHVVEQARAGVTAVARQPEHDGEQHYVVGQTLQASAEREREVEAIEVGGKSWVLHATEVRTGGSSAWLANNPGNMDRTADTDAWGGYEGKTLKWGDHRFALFPSEAVGLRAVRRFLRKHQRERNINLMMAMFAPAGDVGNEPSAYAKQVADALGVPVTTLVKSLTDAQIETFALAIQTVEGWKAGTTYDRRAQATKDNTDIPQAVRDRL